MFPLVREMAAAGAPIRVPVAVACRVLGLSTQGYYTWLRSPVSQRDWDDAHLIDQLRDLHQDDPSLGYRFLADEVADAGVAASENRVWRLCSIAGIFASHARRKSKAGMLPASAHAQPLSSVAPCTIVGTAGPDVLRGTSGDDVICGLAGDDWLYGLGGNDVLRGGPGRDRLSGGLGDDGLLGGTGVDRLQGGLGNDDLLGGPDFDSGSGGPGLDTCSPGEGIADCTSSVTTPPAAGPPGEAPEPATQPSGEAPEPATEPSGEATEPEAETGSAVDDRPRIEAPMPADPDESSDGGSAAPECDPTREMCVVDRTSPVITGVSVSDSVTAGSAFTIRWGAEDASGTISWARVGGSNGWASWCFDEETVQESEGSVAGRFSTTCTPPPSTPIGTYTVFITAVDPSGNSAGAQFDFEITGGSSDTSPPQLIPATSFPTVAPGQSFTLRWSTDDESGVAFTWAWVRAPQGLLVGFDRLPGSSAGEPQLVEGNRLNGTWEQSFTLSSEATPGAYHVLFSVRDEVGNRAVLPGESVDVAAS